MTNSVLIKGNIKQSTWFLLIIMFLNLFCLTLLILLKYVSRIFPVKLWQTVDFFRDIYVCGRVCCCTLLIMLIKLNDLFLLYVCYSILTNNADYMLYVSIFVHVNSFPYYLLEYSTNFTMRKELVCTHSLILTLINILRMHWAHIFP